jgi:uncharacterized protein YndB with AHSA1/START domain
VGKVTKTGLTALLGATLLLTAGVATPAELQDVSVELEDGRYTLRSETYFDVSRESLFRVLTDFDLFEKFTSAIVESHNVEPDAEGRPQFFARMEGCVLLFCKSFIRHGVVLTNPTVEIIAIADPEKSDFKFSRERWELSTDGEGTKMIYEFEMEPAFWVPPVIGPFYIKRALRDGGTRAVDRIEALAQAVALASDPADERQKIVQSASEQ